MSHVGFAALLPDASVLAAFRGPNLRTVSASKGLELEGHSRPQSSSASRVTAGAFGFFDLTQCGERPD
jgi:hypothetical protein